MNVAQNRGRRPLIFLLSYAALKRGRRLIEQIRYVKADLTYEVTWSNVSKCQNLSLQKTWAE